jgi:hypothetical protein
VVSPSAFRGIGAKGKRFFPDHSPYAGIACVNDEAAVPFFEMLMHLATDKILPKQRGSTLSSAAVRAKVHNLPASLQNREELHYSVVMVDRPGEYGRRPLVRWILLVKFGKRQVALDQARVRP